MDLQGRMSCASISGTCLSRGSLSSRGPPCFLTSRGGSYMPCRRWAGGERVSARDVFHLVEDYGVIFGAKRRYEMDYSCGFGAYGEESTASVRLCWDLRPAFSLSCAPALLGLEKVAMHFVRIFAVPSATTDATAKRCRGRNTRRSRWSPYDVLFSAAHSPPTTIPSTSMPTAAYACTECSRQKEPGRRALK